MKSKGNDDVYRTKVAHGSDFAFLCEDIDNPDPTKITDEANLIDVSMHHFLSEPMYHWKDSFQQDPTNIFTTANQSMNRPSLAGDRRHIEPLNIKMTWMIIKCFASAFTLGTKYGTYKEPDVTNIPGLEEYNTKIDILLRQLDQFCRCMFQIWNETRVSLSLDTIVKYPPGGKESVYGDPKFTFKNVLRWANAVHTQAQGTGRAIVVSWTGKLDKDDAKTNPAVRGERRNERKCQKNDGKMFLHHYLNSLAFVGYHKHKVMGTRLAFHYYICMNEIREGKKEYQAISSQFAQLHSEVMDGEEDVGDLLYLHKGDGGEASSSDDE